MNPHPTRNTEAWAPGPGNTTGAHRAVGGAILGPQDRVDEVITKRWCDPGREASGT